MRRSLVIMGGCKQPGKLNESWLDFFCSLFMVCAQDRNFPASYATLPERRCFFLRRCWYLLERWVSLYQISWNNWKGPMELIFARCATKRIIGSYIYIYIYLHRERERESMSVYGVTLFFCSAHYWIVTLKNTSPYMSMSTSLLNFFNFTYVFCWCVSVDW